MKMQVGHGSTFKLQRSTYDTDPRLWLFSRSSPDGPVNGVLHLDRDQASSLVRGLLDFIDEVDRST